MAERIRHYDVGDVWQPQWTFTVGASATDPTTLQVKVMEPDGTVATYDVANPAALTPSSSPIARPSAGVFRLTQALDAAGYWRAYGAGTGAATAAAHQEAVVNPSPFFGDGGLAAYALVSLPEAKDWLNRFEVTADDDLELVSLINDLSERFIEESGNREFKVVGSNPQTRLFWADPVSTTMGVVYVRDLASLDSVRILADDWTTEAASVPLSSVSAEPNPRPPWQPIERLVLKPGSARIVAGQRVEVTGDWGFPAVPGTVKRAILNAVVSMLDRDVQHYRQDFGAVQGTGEGTNVIVNAGRPMILSLPPEAIAEAQRYRPVLVA